jgi:hypothetical protein
VMSNNESHSIMLYAIDSPSDMCCMMKQHFLISWAQKYQVVLMSRTFYIIINKTCELRVRSSRKVYIIFLFVSLFCLLTIMFGDC